MTSVLEATTHHVGMGSLKVNNPWIFALGDPSVVRCRYIVMYSTWYCFVKYDMASYCQLL